MNIEDIITQNPWWKNRGWANTDKHLRQLERYHYVYDRRSDFPLKDGVVVIYGPRQVGKTTLIKEIIRDKLTNSPSDIFYISAENIKERFELYEAIKTIEGIYHPKYYFIDEINSIEDWEKTIKALVDEGLFENKKVVLTGSSSINLMKKAERLPGRMAEGQNKFRYYPLNFAEVVKLYGIEANAPQEALTKLEEINDVLFRYFIHGGFIKAINALYENKILTEEIFSLYSAWIDGELAKIKRSPETATYIMEGIANALTNDISWSSLSKGINHVTVAEYVEILKNMFVVDYLEKARRAGQGLPKNKKIYFIDPFLYHLALFRSRKIDSIQMADFDSMTLGKLAELSVYSNIAQYLDKRTRENDFDLRRYLYFERNENGEIDFILKYQNKNYKIESKFGKIEKEKKDVIYLTKNELASNKLPLAIFLMFGIESFSLLGKKDKE
ncbi:ATP-binding protein [Candidatus Micrarchaeota archaeon]|nr:ATP-binding protein [Candidatus Micrarchaeota archaeon]